MAAEKTKTRGDEVAAWIGRGRHNSRLQIGENLGNKKTGTKQGCKCLQLRITGNWCE